MRFALNGILSGSEDAQTLTHEGVIDNEDVAHIAEVGVELHLHAVGEAVGGVEDMDYLAHGDARREDGGVAGGDDAVANGKACMAGHIIDIGDIARLAVPAQVAEVAATLYHAADAGLGGEHGDDYGIVVGREIDNAHHALAADDAHVGVHTVGGALVDSHVVVALVDRVLHHLGGGETVALQNGRSRKGSVGRVPFLLIKFLGKCLYLVLEVRIAHGELLIEVSQMEVMLHGGLCLIDLGSHGVGGGHERCTLKAVVSEQQREAHHLKQEEDKPMEVGVYEVEEIAHVSISSGMRTYRYSSVRCLHHVLR